MLLHQRPLAAQVGRLLELRQPLEASSLLLTVAGSKSHAQSTKPSGNTGNDLPSTDALADTSEMVRISSHVTKEKWAWEEGKEEIQSVELDVGVALLEVHHVPRDQLRGTRSSAHTI